MEATARDLSRWALHCYSPTARATPHSIVEMDNNGAILGAAVDPIELAELAVSGVSVTESQLRLLVDHGLLRRDGDVISTSFPVLDPDRVLSLREEVGQHAAALAAELSAPIARLHDALDADGAGTSLYATLFGYGLDDLLWDELRSRSLLPSTELDVSHPYWRGVFWALGVGRAEAAGTNFHVTDAATLVMVWTQRTLEALRRLAAEPRLGELIGAAVDGTPGAGLDEFAGADRALIDSTGHVTIPVIRRDAALHERCADVARVAARPITAGALDHISGSIRGADRAAGTVIVAHELIWAIIDALVSASVVDVPEIVRSGRGPVRDVLFITA